MDKEKQLEMCKDYYKKLCATVKSAKAENKKLSPTGFLDRTAEDMENVTVFPLLRKWTVARALLGAAVAIPLLILIGPAIPYYLSGGLVVLTPVMSGLLPSLVGYKMTESKGKFAKIMNKLCLNYTLNRYKKNLEKRFSKVLNAKNANLIDEEELNLFVEATHALAIEYDNYAGNIAFDIIDAEERKNTNKIIKILNKNGLTEKSKEQIKNIVNKTSNTIKAWQDFYLSQKTRIKNLYQAVIDFDPVNTENLECIYKAKKTLSEGLTPPDSTFVEDIQELINEYNMEHNGKYVDSNFLKFDDINKSNKTDFTKNKTKENTHDKNM